MTSCNSASKTLYLSVSVSHCETVGVDTPVEILRSANSNDGVGIGQAGEDADSAIALATSSSFILSPDSNLDLI